MCLLKVIFLAVCVKSLLQDKNTLNTVTTQPKFDSLKQIRKLVHNILIFNSDGIILYFDRMGRGKSNPLILCTERTLLQQRDTRRHS